jgi:hypothetical protein
LLIFGLDPALMAKNHFTFLAFCFDHVPNLRLL